MVNWTTLLGLVHYVNVRKTSRHWIVHVETLHARYPGELFTLAKNLGESRSSNDEQVWVLLE